jgi:hypothetical protein
MKAALKDQVGRKVLSYVDDIVVASKRKTTYIFDLAETLANMREARLKLNPEKCLFEVTRGKVLDCCWGCGARATSRSPMKLYLVHGTFAIITIVNTLIVCFAGRSSLA